jgi:DNA processing protein
LVVALGDILIVAYADINSGTMRSIEYALKMGKEIYVLPHRLTQSIGTNELLEKEMAKVIYDVDKFILDFGDIKMHEVDDDFLKYCKINPNYNELIAKFSTKLFEYELSGKIEIINGKVRVLV